MKKLSESNVILPTKSIFPINSYIFKGKVKKRHPVKEYKDVEPGSIIIIRYYPRRKRWIRDVIGHRAEVKEVYYTTNRNGKRNYAMVVVIREGMLRGFWFRVNYKEIKRP